MGFEASLVRVFLAHVSITYSPLIHKTYRGNLGRSKVTVIFKNKPKSVLIYATVVPKSVHLHTPRRLPCNNQPDLAFCPHVPFAWPMPCHASLPASQAARRTSTQRPDYMSLMEARTNTGMLGRGRCEANVCPHQPALNRDWPGTRKLALLE